MGELDPHQKRDFMTILKRVREVYSCEAFLNWCKISSINSNTLRLRQMCQTGFSWKSAAELPDGTFKDTPKHAAVRALQG